MDNKFPFEVENFLYNGFIVKPLPGKAYYQAAFKEWTRDPGVARCVCSDGEERLIPSCQLIGDKSCLPQQSYENKEMFGESSHS